MFQTAIKKLRPFSTPINVIIPTIRDEQGKDIKDYKNPAEKFLMFCSFKTFGGTETVNNGVITTLETAEITTYFDPRIKANCRIELAESEGETFDILGAPEDLDKSHEIFKFKVQRVRGGA